MLIFGKNGILKVGFAVILLSMVYLDYVYSKAGVFLNAVYLTTINRLKADGGPTENMLCSRYTYMMPSLTCQLHIKYCLSENIQRKNCSTPPVELHINYSSGRPRSFSRSDFYWNRIPRSFSLSDFGWAYAKRLPKEFIYTLDTFNESVAITVSIFEGSNQDPYNLVTQISSQLIQGAFKFEPSYAKHFTLLQRRSLTNEKGDVLVAFQFGVWCLPHYYGPECTIFCRGIDSKDGHYLCTSSGEKKCLLGWTNPVTNCTVPYSTCSPFPCTFMNKITKTQ